MRQLRPDNPNDKKGWEFQYEKKVKTPERVNDWMYEALIPYIPEHGDILEVGCGMGRTLEEVAKHNDGQIAGVDISDIAIEKAKELYPEFTLSQMDAHKMGFKEEFDFIICSQTLEHVDKPDLIVKNIVNALKKGGTLFITVPKVNSSLDRGVKWHYWTIEVHDFQGWLPKCKISHLTKSHTLVTWKK